MATHNELGRIGEDLAVDFLMNQGYEILERNWRYRKAEIDIIAQKDGMLSIVEVKTRNSYYFGEPESFVSKKKMKLLIVASDHFVIKNDFDVEVSFDIVSIVKNTQITDIKHIKNAFHAF
ncbi:MAG: YraN family protein [Flavobacteriaceae bacterium]|nr:YraN family protein [Flavobacteriaceae bacterium]